jgi:transcriptional regulator with XRE-family HTH domain
MEGSKLKMGRLRALREKMGISQTELAKRMGIVRPTYSNYEAGNREPDFDTIKRLADFFSVSIDYLLENDLDATKTDKAKNAVDNPKYARLPIQKKKIIDDMIDALSEE